MNGYDKESKVFFIEKKAELLANEIYLYDKYYKDNNETFEQLYQTSNDNIIITEDEKRLLFDRAKKILIEKYNMKLIRSNPVIVEKL